MSAPSAAQRRVAVVGAGAIAAVHMEALDTLPGLTVVAVVDSDPAKAARLADRWGIGRRHDSVGALLEAGDFDAAHVLVPPQHHRRVAEPILRSGRAVFVEKPLCVTSGDCAALMEAAQRNGAALGVNQNFVFHPAHRALRKVADDRDLGALVHLDLHYAMPLRQLAARQLGHWMFRSPVNILLEQAVHPLSQLVDLAGAVRTVDAVPCRPMIPAPGIAFHDRWMVTLGLERATAQLFLAFGHDHPAWRLTALFQDGRVDADMVHDRVHVESRSRWPDFYDSYLTGRSLARSATRQSRRNAAAHLLSTLRVVRRNDPFFRSMKAGIAAFHDGLDRGHLPIDGAFGAGLVDACERIAAPVMVRRSPPADVAVPVAATDPIPDEGMPDDIAVLGGTGFIGTHLVARLLRDGHRVRVLARTVDGLPSPFDDPRVRPIRGDVTRPEDVARAVGAARRVVNLAHGGGAGSWSDIERAMVGSARTVARVCLDRGVRRLVHVGSIAALYLGDADAQIAGDTPVDARPERRAPYGRAKAMADRLLLRLHHEEGLPVTILRPGVVVGDGGTPFPSGIGFFNTDRHCMGWNRGDNPLPFVLAEDVADAIARALDAEGIDGRCYNLVGDVRPSARDYVADLARVLDRPLRYHPQSPWRLQAVEMGKWMVKLAIRKPDNSFPDPRDLRSRGLAARIDCSDAKRDLGWRPVADRDMFIRRAMAVHRRTS